MGHMLIVKGSIDASWLLSHNKNIMMIIPRLIGELTWRNLSSNETKDIKCEVTLQTVLEILKGDKIVRLLWKAYLHSGHLNMSCWLVFLLMIFMC